MDSLCKDMGNPSFLLDGLISSGQFCDWIDTHEEEKAEQKLWELYIHKIPAWDDRSFNDFKFDLLGSMGSEPTEEDIFATVANSKEMLNNFQIQEGG